MAITCMDMATIINTIMVTMTTNTVTITLMIMGTTIPMTTATITRNRTRTITRTITIITMIMITSMITITDTNTRMTDATGVSALDLALLAWASPAYPVGAFAYSHGVEWAIESGDVSDGESLYLWLSDILNVGSGRNDAILFAAAWRAAANDPTELTDTAELAVALAGSSERRLESLQQGAGFLAATRAAWPSATLETCAAAIGADTAYSVCFAAAVAARGLPLRPALDIYLSAFASNLVSATVRLSIIGQTEGQKIVARLSADIGPLAATAEQTTLDDLGGCAFRADLAALHHETQYSRLFRS